MRARKAASLCLNRSHVCPQDSRGVEEDHRIVPCPLKWLDSFSMRNFTNASAFDDTLPLSDGQMEIGSTVPLDQLKDAMEDLVSAQGLLPKGSRLLLVEK